MPKSKNRRVPKGQASGRGFRGPGMVYSLRDRRRDLVVLGGIIVLAAGFYMTSLWRGYAAGSELLALAAEGQAGLQAVENLRSLGRDHLQPGETYRYRDSFPTSGPHAPRWLPTGFYDEPQSPHRLVHSLEHGNVVIYYDKLTGKAENLLRDWVSAHSGQWDGLIAAPMPGIGEEVVLTAWTKRLRLDPFDPASAAAFIDLYRGRGPEHPVR